MIRKGTKDKLGLLNKLFYGHSKIINYELFKKNAIRFQPNINNFEDSNLNRSLLSGNELSHGKLTKKNLSKLLVLRLFFTFAWENYANHTRWYK